MPEKIRIFAGAGLLAVLALAGVWLLNGPGLSGPSGPVGDGEVRPYLRLAVSRDAGSATLDIAQVWLVETPVRPLTAPGGYYAVLDGPEGALSAVPFAFAAEAVEEYQDQDVVLYDTVNLALQSVMVFLPYEPDAVGVRVLDAAGATVAEIDDAAFDDATASHRLSPLSRAWARARSIVAPTAHAASLIDLQVSFPHILFPQAEGDLSFWHQHSPNSTVTAVVPIDDYWATALHDALSELSVKSPLLFGSLGSVAIVDYDAGGIATTATCDGNPVQGIRRGDTKGNHITINARGDIRGGLNTAAQLRSTLVHESTHAFNNLIDSGTSVTPENLPTDILEKVNDIRANLGDIPNALTLTWVQLHGTAKLVYMGYGDYEGSQARCVYSDDSSAVAAGFASWYGATSYKEDFATYVQVFYDSAQSLGSDPVCQQFSGLTDEVPREKLLPFAKLNFLRALGLVLESDYESCVQNADPASEEGFHIPDERYDQGLKASVLEYEPGVSDLGGVPGSRFVVLGATSSAQAMLQIRGRRPPLNSPIGFHRLDETAGWATPYRGFSYQKENDLPIGMSGRNYLSWQSTQTSGRIELVQNTRISTGGFVLIVSDTPELTKGYAFFVIMDDWLGRRRAVLDLVWFRLEDD